jgi:hypothetical protein
MMTVEEALRRLMPAMPELSPGHVWLAGAGPGESSGSTPSPGSPRRT